MFGENTQMAVMQNCDRIAEPRFLISVDDGNVWLSGNLKEASHWWVDGKNKELHHTQGLYATIIEEETIYSSNPEGIAIS